MDKPTKRIVESCMLGDWFEWRWILYDQDVERQVAELKKGDKVQQRSDLYGSFLSLNFLY